MFYNSSNMSLLGTCLKLVNVGDGAIKQNSTKMFHFNFVSLIHLWQLRKFHRISIWWGHGAERQIQSNLPPLFVIHHAVFMLQSERRWSFFSSSALFLCFPNGAQSSHKFATTGSRPPHEHYSRLKVLRR